MLKAAEGMGLRSRFKESAAEMERGREGDQS